MMKMTNPKKRSRAGAVGKAAAFVQDATDNKQQSQDKKTANRKRMRVVQMQRALERKERDLRAFPKFPVPVKPAREKGPLRPDEWKLKGAARPAALLARIAAGECNDRGEEIAKPVETYDLFQQQAKNGKLAENEHTREYLSILKQLAEACVQAGMPDRGIKHYKQCMKYDPQDFARAREGLACALIDEGRGDEARELIEKYKGNSSAVLAYCLVILEYVSWEVLEEAGSSEQVVREALLKAFKLNPFIAVFLARNETFLDAIEYVEDIKDPKVGSIEEAFVYCTNNIGVWLDTVGATAWIDKELEDLEEPVATAEHCSDEMYLGMYETANEMHKEGMAAEVEEEGDGEGQEEEFFDDEDDEDDDNEEADGVELDEPWGDQE